MQSSPASTSTTLLNSAGDLQDPAPSVSSDGECEIDGALTSASTCKATEGVDIKIHEENDSHHASDEECGVRVDELPRSDVMGGEVESEGKRESVAALPPAGGFYDSGADNFLSRQTSVRFEGCELEPGRLRRTHVLGEEPPNTHKEVQGVQDRRAARTKAALATEANDRHGSHQNFDGEHLANQISHMCTCLEKLSDNVNLLSSKVANLDDRMQSLQKAHENGSLHVTPDPPEKAT